MCFGGVTASRNSTEGSFDEQWLCVQANESCSMRGMKRLASDAACRFKQQQEAGGDDTAHGAPGFRGAVTRNGV